MPSKNIYDLKKEANKILRGIFRSKNTCFYLNCNKPAIKSHTISESELRKVSSDGKIYHLKFDIFKNDFILKEEGVNNFSIFYGFCKKHDNELFSCIDNFFDFDKNNIQKIAFLSLYRIICKELFLKSACIKSTQNFKNNVNFEEVDFLSSEIMNIGHYLAIRDLTKIYNRLTQNLIKSKFNTVKYKILTFNKTDLPFAFSSCYFPEKNDETGEFFQELDNIEETMSVISFASLHSKDKGYILLSWHKTDNEICSRFVKMLLRKNKIEILQYIFEKSENLAINKNYYKNLNQQEKNDLKIKFKKVFEELENCLSQS